MRVRLYNRPIPSRPHAVDTRRAKNRRVTRRCLSLSLSRLIVLMTNKSLLLQKTEHVLPAHDQGVARTHVAIEEICDERDVRRLKQKLGHLASFSLRWMCKTKRIGDQSKLISTLVHVLETVPQTVADYPAHRNAIELYVILTLCAVTCPASNNRQRLCETPRALDIVLGLVAHDSSLRQVKISALRCLSNMACTTGLQAACASSKQSVGEHDGVVTTLVQLIAAERESQEFNMEVVRCLRNLAYNSPQNAEKIGCTPGAIDMLVGLMGAEEWHVHTVKQVIGCLLNLSESCPRNIIQIRENKQVIAMLIHVISICNAVDACKEHMESKSGALTLLYVLLRDAQRYTEEAARAMTHVVSTEGVLEALSYNLTVVNDERTQRNVLHCLSCMTQSSDDALRHMGSRCAIMDSLVGVLKTSIESELNSRPHEDICELSVRLLCRISSLGPRNARRIGATSHVFVALQNATMSSCASTRRYAAGCLHYVALHAPVHHTVMIVTKGVIASLVRIISRKEGSGNDSTRRNDDDEETILHAIYCLASLTRDMQFVAGTETMIEPALGLLRSSGHCGIRECAARCVANVAGNTACGAQCVGETEGAIEVFASRLTDRNLEHLRVQTHTMRCMANVMHGYRPSVHRIGAISGIVDDLVHASASFPGEEAGEQAMRCLCMLSHQNKTNAERIVAAPGVLVALLFYLRNECVRVGGKLGAVWCLANLSCSCSSFSKRVAEHEDGMIPALFRVIDGVDHVVIKVHAVRCLVGLSRSDDLDISRRIANEPEAVRCLLRIILENESEALTEQALRCLVNVTKLMLVHVPGSHELMDRLLGALRHASRCFPYVSPFRDTGAADVLQEMSDLIKSLERNTLKLEPIATVVQRPSDCLQLQSSDMESPGTTTIELRVAKETGGDTTHDSPLPELNIGNIGTMWYTLGQLGGGFVNGVHVTKKQCVENALSVM